MNSLFLAIRNHPYRLIVVLLLIIAGLGAWRWWPRYYDLTINVNPTVSDFSVKVYPVKEGQDVGSATSSQPVAEVKQTQTLNLRQGNYLVLSGPEPDFIVTIKDVKLESNTSVDITPAYSSTKLDDLLKAESSAIQQAVRSSVYGFSDGFSIGPGKLFGLGEWYGTIIYPNLSDEELRLQYVDVYRLVMKKENGVWKLATNPPQLILGDPDYPEIPREVLDNVNDQKQP